jgi:hypothetical protein
MRRRKFSIGQRVFQGDGDYTIHDGTIIGVNECPCGCGYSRITAQMDDGEIREDLEPVWFKAYERKQFAKSFEKEKQELGVSNNA